MQKVNYLITTAAFVVVVAGMRAAESLLIPFLLSVFIAVICAPSVFWLQRKGLPTILAVLTITLLILGLEVALVTLIGTSINDFSSNLPFYQKRLTEEATNLVALENIKAMLARNARTEGPGTENDPSKPAAGARPSAPGGREIKLPKIPVKRDMPKVGRNQPCPCGSGKKYKHCHGA